MSIGSRIKELREVRGLSRSELARRVGVSPSAISNYEYGTSAPKEEILFKLFEVLKCDANYLYQDDIVGVDLFSTTFDEQEFIRKYRKLDKFDQKTLNLIADRLLSKVDESAIVYASHPVFLMPASAGTGIFLDSDDYELVEFPKEVIPEDSNFAVRVSGDSMKPDFPDGSIAFIKQSKRLNPGDVGLFILNNEGFLKVLGDSNHLISLNPEYDDIEIKTFDDCRVVGKVVGSYETLNQPV